MKKALFWVPVLLLCCLLAASASASDLPIDGTYFPNDTFRSYIAATFDLNSDGMLSETERNAVETINVNSLSNRKEITSLKGIEHFPNLTDLRCSGCSLTRLDVSRNPALSWLDCDKNQLTRLDVTGNTALEILDCANNKLIDLDLNRNTALEDLDCSYNQIESLDVSRCRELRELDVSSNSISHIDLSANTKLTRVLCGNCYFFNLDLSGHAELTYLACYGCSRLANLNVSGCTKLNRLACSGTALTQLDLSTNTKLTEVDCSNSSKLRRLNAGACSMLKKLDCSYCNLYSLDVSGNPVLSTLNCSGNPFCRLDLTQNTALTDLNCFSCSSLESLNLNGHTALKTLNCGYSGVKSLDVSGCTGLTTLSCQGTSLLCLDLGSNSALSWSNGTEVGSRSVYLEGNTLDLSTFSGFEVQRTSGWNGAALQGSILTFAEPSGGGAYQASYTYDCGGGKTAVFEIFAFEPDPNAEPGIGFTFPDGVRTYAGTPYDFQVYTTNGIRKLRMCSETGTVLESWDENSDNYIRSSDGSMITWEVSHVFETEGYGQTLIFRGSTDGVNYDVEKTACFDVQEAQPRILDLDYNETVELGEPAGIVIRTPLSAQSIQMFEKTAYDVKYWNINTVSYTDQDGFRRWYIDDVFDEAGYYDVSFAASTNLYFSNLAECGPAVPAQITVRQTQPSVLNVYANADKIPYSVSRVTFTVETPRNALHLRMQIRSEDDTDTVIRSSGYADIGERRYWIVPYAGFWGTGDYIARFSASMDGVSYGGWSEKWITVHEDEPDVTDVSADRTSVDVGDTVYFIVNTPLSASKIGLFLDSGEYAAYTWYSSESTEIDNRREWRIRYAFTEQGTYTVSFKASRSGSYYGAAKSIGITVGEPQPEVISVTADQTTVQATDPVIFTVTTGISAQYVRVEEAYTYDPQVFASGYTDTDAGRVWRIAWLMGGEGKHDIEFRASTNGQYYGMGRYISITVEGEDSPPTPTPETETPTPTPADETPTPTPGDETPTPTPETETPTLTPTATPTPTPTPTLAPPPTPTPQSGDIAIDSVHFPDPAFRQYILEELDTDENGSLSESERADVSEVYVSFSGIRSLEGIGWFPGLESLSCGYNELTSLDLSGNPALEELICYSNSLSGLDLSGNSALTRLDCDDNQLTGLDVAHLSGLEYLRCSGNRLTGLDVTRNSELKELYCYSNSLSGLDLSGNSALTRLDCDDNQLTGLDVSGNPGLEYLSCSRNRLTSLDVSGNPDLEDLYCNDNERTLMITGNSLDLDTLPGFDLSRASGWSEGMLSGNRLILDGNCEVTYTYDCGGGKSAEFVLDVIIRTESMLILPDDLKVIETEAFMNGQFTEVIIPEGCERIESRAFANCSSLTYIRIPYAAEVADDAFDGCDVDLEIDYR